MCPGERYQLLLAHIYAARDGRTALGPGSDFDRLQDALTALGAGRPPAPYAKTSAPAITSGQRSNLEHYTEALGVPVLGPDGTEIAPIMGSYGIGIARAMAAIVESHHDGAGIVWPVAVAP